MSSSAGLMGWRLATRLLTPVAPLLLRQRAARGKEDWTRLNERLGIAGLPRPSGRLIWLRVFLLSFVAATLLAIVVAVVLPAYGVWGYYGLGPQDHPHIEPAVRDLPGVFSGLCGRASMLYDQAAVCFGRPKPLCFR